MWPIRDAYATAACFDAIKQLLQVDIPQKRVARGDVAADMTGGTKPMTAAMVLACVATGNNILEHVPARYNSELRGPVALAPIHVSYHFALPGESPLPEE